MKKKFDHVNDLEITVFDETSDFKKYPFPYQHDLIEYLQSIDDKNKQLHECNIKLRFLNNHISNQETDLVNNDLLIEFYKISNHPDLEYYQKYQSINYATLKINHNHRMRLTDIIVAIEKQKTIQNENVIRFVQGKIVFPKGNHPKNFVTAYISIFKQFTGRHVDVKNNLKGLLSVNDDTVMNYSKKSADSFMQYSELKTFDECLVFIKRNFDENGKFIGK